MSVRWINVSLQKYTLGSASIDFCLRLSLCASGPPAPPFAMEFVARSDQSGVQSRPGRFLARPGKALGLQAHPVLTGITACLVVCNILMSRYFLKLPPLIEKLPENTITS